MLSLLITAMATDLKIFHDACSLIRCHVSG